MRATRGAILAGIREELDGSSLTTIRHWTYAGPVVGFFTLSFFAQCSGALFHTTIVPEGHGGGSSAEVGRALSFAGHSHPRVLMESPSRVGRTSFGFIVPTSSGEGDPMVANNLLALSWA